MIYCREKHSSIGKQSEDSSKCDGEWWRHIRTHNELKLDNELETATLIFFAILSVSESENEIRFCLTVYYRTQRSTLWVPHKNSECEQIFIALDCISQFRLQVISHYSQYSMWDAGNFAIIAEVKNLCDNTSENITGKMMNCLLWQRLFPVRLLQSILASWRYHHVVDHKQRKTSTVQGGVTDLIPHRYFFRSISPSKS